MGSAFFGSTRFSYADANESGWTRMFEHAVVVSIDQEIKLSCLIVFAYVVRLVGSWWSGGLRDVNGIAFITLI